MLRGMSGIANNFQIAWDAVPSTYLCRALATASTHFKDKPPPNDDFWNTIMPFVKERACTMVKPLAESGEEPSHHVAQGLICDALVGTKPFS
jgi:hypothetical protein